MYVYRTYCGFSKILKKHDKMTGHCTREQFMKRCVNIQPFTQHDRTIELIKEVEAIYAELPSMLVEATAPPPDAPGDGDGTSAPAAAAAPTALETTQYDAGFTSAQELASEVSASDGAAESVLTRAPGGARGAVGLKSPLPSPRPSDASAAGEAGAAGEGDGPAAVPALSVVAHAPPPQSREDMMIIDAIIHLKDQNARMMQEESGGEMQAVGPISGSGSSLDRTSWMADPIVPEDGALGESPPGGGVAVVGKKRKGG